jgi:hypothetical protein
LALTSYNSVIEVSKATTPQEVSLGELRERMQHDLVVRGLVPRTQESYLVAVKGLAQCRGRECPAEFSPPFRQPMSEDNMTQQAIFGPFFATMFLTLLVWVYMYIRRISFITSNKFGSKELATPGALARLSPPEVANPSDNLKNLFEIPVLFYALVLYLFVTNQVDAVYVNAAWVFVVFRALHSAVHCTFNLIMLRFYLYLFATLAVWFIAIRAALIHFGA